MPSESGLVGELKQQLPHLNTTNRLLGRRETRGMAFDGVCVEVCKEPAF